MIQIILTHITTSIFCLIIVVVFIYFFRQAYKVISCKKNIENAFKSDTLFNFKNDKYQPICDVYQQTIFIPVGISEKTNIPASLYFSDQAICKANKLNLRMLDTAAGTLVGLGLIGTFLGLTLGVSGFDSTNTEHIQESIQTLLGGMGTAFFTSLLGMFLSLVYVFFEKRWKNKFARSLFDFTEKLDKKYYIDDISLMHLNQKQLMSELHSNMESYLDNQTKKLISKLDTQLSYVTEDGKKVELGNAVREILKENTEQSTALKSFSTDLADSIENNLDTVLSNQLQDKLVPLMQNIDKTTNLVVEHIDKMSEKVASPASDMIEKVVDELQNSMKAIMEEFKTNLSGSATKELEQLASSLSTAAESMADFPKNMEKISATLEVTIQEVKNSISEISKTSASTNNSAMTQMQEQISFAVSTMSNAIMEVKEVMSQLSKSSEQSSQEVINKLVSASDNMGQSLSKMLENMSSNMNETVKGITDDVNNKQTDLLEMQGSTMNQAENLMTVFNHGLERMEQMNEYITGTMSTFQKAQGEITGSTSNLQRITGDMKLATELFQKSQNDYSTQVASLQNKIQSNLESVTQLLIDSGEMSDDYVNKFETIKLGLSSIFSQLQAGLNEYSTTVQTSTQEYLNQYSENLTTTTGALSSTIDQQNQVVEMLTESIDSMKKRTK